ncbi:MAG: bifunctional heptose 7-phosphate kinase/heptose 1-phosphate adenyltransferase [Planctomycetes bacterium]|nr:bifunctional heptose 7-phosphate kinase/heptose 1-phosphate adenyltransferase [Planctomycetota bacterium]
MHENLLKIVTNLGSPKVLLVGDFMLDVYVYGDALRISPEAPVPVLRVTDTEYRCGGAGSVAANLAALGAVPVCVGVIGGNENDQNAKILNEKLAATRADISGLLSVPGRGTTTKQRLIGLAQHRHRQQLMRVDQESTEPLTDEQYQKILQIYKDKLPKIDIVCLQDYNKGLLTPSLCRQMIQLAAQADKKVLVDPSRTSDYSKYTGATLITPNRKEASIAVGFEITSEQTAAKAAKKLFTDYKLKAVVITLDSQGAYLTTEHLSRIIPTRPRSIYDVTGAGDTVLATLAITLAAGRDYETAVQLSNLAGGIEVEKFGAEPVQIQQILNEIRGETGKLLSLDSLLDELNWHRSRGKTVAFTNGCFDVVHRGHIEYLKFTKQQADVVVLGLNSDSSVKIIKGPDRPINNQHDRAAVLAALETIDYITIFDEPTPIDLIEKVRPDTLVKGEDWAQKGVVGREFVESYGGRVVLAPIVEGKSSTATIEKIKSLQAKSS